MTIHDSNVREKLLQLGSQKRYNFTAEYARCGYKVTYRRGLDRDKLVPHKNGKDALPIPNTTKGKNELLGYIMLENKKFYQENNRPYYPWYVEKYKKFLDQRSSNTV